MNVCRGAWGEGLRHLSGDQTTPACCSLAGSGAGCEANRESSHSRVPSLVEWESQEGLVCKCARKEVRAKGPPLVSSLSVGFTTPPTWSRLSIQSQSGPREPLTHWPPVLFRWTLVFMWGGIGPGASLCHCSVCSLYPRISTLPQYCTEKAKVKGKFHKGIQTLQRTNTARKYCHSQSRGFLCNFISHAAPDGHHAVKTSL